MKGRKNILTILFFPLLFIAVAFTMGCPSASPIGSLTGDSSPSPGPGTVPDYIRVKLTYAAYEDGDWFYSDYVEVTKISGSGRESIDTDNISISIWDSNGDSEEVPPLPDGLQLHKNGDPKKSETKTVFVNYQGMEDFAHIYVFDYGAGVSEGGGGPGIEIIWND